MWNVNQSRISAQWPPGCKAAKVNMNYISHYTDVSTKPLKMTLGVGDLGVRRGNHQEGTAGRQVTHHQKSTHAGQSRLALSFTVSDSVGELYIGKSVTRRASTFAS